MQPVGIEPTSTVLQTAAMTTSAKVAYLAGSVRDFLSLLVQCLTLLTGVFGTVDENRTRLDLLDREVLCPDNYHGIKLASCTGIDPVPTP